MKKTIKLDVMLIILLICCGLKLTFHIDRLIDIALYDETGYLQRALSIPVSGMPSASTSPLYSIWYYFLSAFAANPIDLFYLNIKLQIILLPIFFFIFLRTLKINPLYSLIGAFYLLISYGNIFPMPRSALFATMIMVIFFIFFALVKNDFIKIMILASGCLVASFIRPEYFLGFIAFIIFAIVLYIIRKENTRFFLTTIFSFFLLWAAIIYWAGNPFTDGYATRGFWAFAQNFSYNYATWENLNINPWTNTDKIIEQHFGNSHNLLLAFLANPVLILKHFFSNLLLYFKYLYLILFVHLNVILPSSQRIFSFIESLMVVGFIFYLGAKNRTAIRSKLPNIFKDHQILFISFAIIYLQSMFILILTIPRHEFITIHLIIISTFFLLLGEHCFFIDFNYQTSTIILIFLVALAATPYISNNWYFTFPKDAYLPQRKLYNYKTIRFIQNLNLKNNINILEAEGGINVYLGPQFRWIPEYEKKESFFQYLDKRKINAILSTDNLVNDIRFRNDTEWRDFLTDYQQYGFSKYAVPDTDRVIYVKNTSLP